MYKSFTLKSFFLIFLIIILKPPLNDPTDIIFFSIGLFIIFSFKTNKRQRINIFFLFIIIILILTISLISKKKDISEYHSTFFSKEDINVFNNFLPNKVIKDINDKYKKFDLERALSSHDGSQYQSVDNFNQYKFIENQYSFSSDNLILNKSNTRNVDHINFNSRESLKIGEINDLKYNIAFDKEFRRMIPYYVLFIIPKNYKYSKVCGKGNIFYTFEDNIKEFDNLNFINKEENKCIYFEKNENLLIIGYSINNNDELELKLHKNKFTLFKDIINFTSIIFFIFIFTYNFFTFKSYSRKEVIIFALSIFSSIFFIILKDTNIISGLRYFRGGADGLVYEFQANMIIKNIYNLDFLQALRGGEDSFYYMPGLRYFLAASKIIFGDTNYGYIFIILILPISLFYVFKNLISEKIAFYLIISFTLLPIFENMGFGHFNYVHQAIRNHAETLSITIIIFCIAKISDIDFYKKINFYNIFFYCLILSFSALCRPNFVPITTLFFIYLFFISYRKNIVISSGAIFGYSFIFIAFLHNLYFGNDLSLFTKSNVHFAFNDAFQKLNFNDKNIILNQFLKWNPIYNFHRLIMLIFVFYCFFRFNKSNFISFLFFSMIAQHVVLILTHPDSRYAYLAWLLTFILFIFYLFNFYLKKFK